MQVTVTLGNNNYSQGNICLLRQFLCCFVFMLNWKNCPNERLRRWQSLKPVQKAPVLSGQSEERNFEDTCTLARGEKRSKTNQKTNLRLLHRLQSLGGKRNRIGGIDVFSCLETRVSHIRDCSFTPSKIAPPTSIMRGEAGRNCDHQIKCKLESMMKVFWFLAPLINRWHSWLMKIGL